MSLDPLEGPSHGVPSPPSSPDMVTLCREGCEDVYLMVEQIIPTVVARIFSVSLETLWLRESGGGRATFFPDSRNRHFDFTADVGLYILRLAVEGVAANSSSSNRVFSSSPTAGHISPKPVGINCKKTSMTVKIVQASVKKCTPSGRPEFKPLSQAFVDVTESTANVMYLSHIIKEKWGTDHVLVTADGMKIEDGSGTQGLKFWKVGSRKIFAVSKKTLHVADSSSSDSDLEPPARKSAKTVLSSTEYVTLNQNIKAIRSQVDSIANVQKTLKVPLSVRKLVMDNFKCIICQSIMSPPIIFAKCCKRLLGCEACIDTLYRGEGGMQQKCPQCRSERAYADTCRAHGIDDFLIGILKIISTDGDETE